MAVLIGRVTEPSAGLPLPGAEIRLVWKVPRGVADTIQGELRTTADGQGQFRLCDVPADSRLSVWATALGRVGNPASLFLSGGEERRQDLSLPLGVTTRGAINGVLLDAQTRKPLRDATLRLERADAEALSNAQGQFRFRGLPTGVHALSIHHVAYGTQQVEIEVLSNRTRHVEISLAAIPIALDPITVTLDVRPVWLERVGFYARQAKGLGQFMDPEWMERRSPYRFSQVLENVHGLKIRPVQCNPHCEYLVQTTTSSGLCPATFYIDGMKLRLGSLVDLDALVPASDVAAVEVYRGISQTPPRYYGKCGSVVIWTKRG